MLSKYRSAILITKQAQKESVRLISSKEVIEREEKYAAHNYHPLPAALCKGRGNTTFNYLTPHTEK